VYLITGVMKIDKKFAKFIKAVSADDAKSKLLKEVGSAGSDVRIDSVFIQTPKKVNKRFS